MATKGRGVVGRAIVAAALGLIAAVGWAAPAPEDRDAFEAVRRLGRGINFGNALDAPSEGAWGMELKAEYFAAVRQAGFDSVRIPIRWSAHADEAPPYALDPAFAARVDWAVAEALKNHLAVVLNVHHYEGMDQDPARNKGRLAALWRQIAERYKQQPDTVVFELLNEPHDKLTDELWNDVFPELLAAVRASNPRRPVVIGPGHWNGIGSLDKLRLPEDDRRLIVTVHYYSPFEFTHQGAEWAPGSAKWKGRTWTGTPAETAALEKDFNKVADWANQRRRPVYLGEFGAYQAADMASRARWTAAVARAAEQRGWAWTYWEFGSGFGAYDRPAHAWREPLLKALVPNGGQKPDGR